MILYFKLSITKCFMTNLLHEDSLLGDEEIKLFSLLNTVNKKKRWNSI
jgi:hypothetical protein